MLENVILVFKRTDPLKASENTMYVYVYPYMCSCVVIFNIYQSSNHISFDGGWAKSMHPCHQGKKGDSQSSDTNSELRDFRGSTDF